MLLHLEEESTKNLLIIEERVDGIQANLRKEEKVLILTHPLHEQGNNAVIQIYHLQGKAVIPILTFHR